MSKNQRKSGAILAYVQIILSNTISLLYTPFALRMLGQSQYGLFGTAGSFTGYLSLLSLGIGGAYIRWNAKYRAENDVEGERRLNGMFFTMFSIITFVTLIVGLIMLVASTYIFGNSFNSSELTDLKIIIFVNVITSALTFFFTPVLACIQAYEKFLIIRIVSIVNILITPILNIPILIFGGKAVALTYANFLLSCINFIVYFIYARKRLKMKFIFKGFKFSVFKEILVFSSFLFLNTLTNLVSDSTDSIILGAVSGTTAVAIYTIGHNFQNYFLNFSTAVSGVFAPQVNKIVAEKQDDSQLLDLMIRVGRIQFYIVSLILIGYIFLGKQFIVIWAGENYVSSYLIGLLLLLASYIPLFQNVGLEIQKAKNKHKFRSVVYFLIAIVNIILTIPGAIFFGGVGAAFATFICCFIGQATLMNIYYHKSIGLNMFKFWNSIIKILPSFILPILTGIIINIFFDINNIWKLLFAIIVMICVFSVSVWFFSFNDYEKNIIKNPLNKAVSVFKKKK